MTYAYTGDYVLEEKYKQLLPQAVAGNAEAQYSVGEMLERGKGVNRDQSAAFSWYSKAAEQGHTKGAFRTGLAYLKGKGVRKNISLAYKWLQLAADKGYERANYYLGVMYEKGEGVKLNLTRALSHYKLALSAGYAPAKDRINQVKETIAEEERREQARAEAAARRAALAKKRAAAARAQKVSAKPVLSTKEFLLKGGWKKKNRPAEYLPSAISDCSDKGHRIECMSKEVKRNIGTADIAYQTKAVIFSIDDDGSFKISYRNYVNKVKPKDSVKKADIPVKEGWQDAEHILECAMEEETSVTCTKDKVRKVSFSRK